MNNEKRDVKRHGKRVHTRRRSANSVRRVKENRNPIDSRLRNTVVAIVLLFSLLVAYAIFCVTNTYGNDNVASALEIDSGEAVEYIEIVVDGTEEDFVKVTELEVTEEPTVVNEIDEVEEISETPTVKEAGVVQADSIDYSMDDLEALALVIYQEAGSDACSDDTRLKVGNVVLNRVNSTSFPNTIQSVLTAKNQYGRLHYTGLVRPSRASKQTEAGAVQRAYDCAERLLSGERVLPDDVIWQAEFIQGTEVVCHQDGFYFCR